MKLAAFLLLEDDNVADAMIDMLLPLAAVAFGLTALGIVFDLSHG